MKHAAAMKYGGELVAAADCTYDSYLLLGTLCPECKEPVYLKSGGDRVSVKGTPYKIGPHFSHRKGTSEEQVASCETRVSNYTDKDRQRIAAKAKGQRLKLLQRWFWKVLMSWDPVSWVPVVDGLGGDWVESVKRVRELDSSCTESILIMNAASVLTGLSKKGLDETIDYLWPQVLIAAENNNSKMLKETDYKMNGWNKQMRLFTQMNHSEQCLHVSICKEVFGFLIMGKNQSTLLLDTITYSLLRTWANWSWGGIAIVDSNEKQTIDVFFSQIVAIPWASEFQRLEAESQQRKDAA